MEIHCQEKFDEVKKYAESIGDQTFNNCIERLKEWKKMESILFICTMILQSTASTSRSLMLTVVV